MSKGEKLYKEMNVDGCIIFPKQVNEDDAWKLFINALENAGLEFGGGTSFDDEFEEDNINEHN